MRMLNKLTNLTLLLLVALVATRNGVHAHPSSSNVPLPAGVSAGASRCKSVTSLRFSETISAVGSDTVNYILDLQAFVKAAAVPETIVHLVASPRDNSDTKVWMSQDPNWCETGSAPEYGYEVEAVTSGAIVAEWPASQRYFYFGIKNYNYVSSSTWDVTVSLRQVHINTTYTYLDVQTGHYNSPKFALHMLKPKTASYFLLKSPEPQQLRIKERLAPTHKYLHTQTLTTKEAIKFGYAGVELRVENCATVTKPMWLSLAPEDEDDEFYTPVTVDFVDESEPLKEMDDTCGNVDGLIFDITMAAFSNLTYYFWDNPSKYEKTTYTMQLGEDRFATFKVVGKFYHSVSPIIVLYSKEARLAIAAFRGTNSVYDVFNDFDVFMTTCDFCSDPDSKVHAGFYSALADNKPALTELLDELRNKEGTDEIIFTGHSLGGAVATLAADVFSGYLGNTLVRVSCITFGSPRVGDEYFASEYRNQRIGGYVFRSRRFAATQDYPDTGFLSFLEDVGFGLSGSLDAVTQMFYLEYGYEHVHGPELIPLENGQPVGPDGLHSMENSYYKRVHKRCTSDSRCARALASHLQSGDVKQALFP